MSPSSQVWVVRGGDNNELARQIKAKGAVAIGWPVGDLAGITDRDHLKRQIEEIQPAWATPNSVGQLFRFLKEIRTDDLILTPERATKLIHITRCAGGYTYDPALFGPEYPNSRPVEYLKAAPRSLFPPAVRNTLGSVLTVFRADVALPYIEAFLRGQTPKFGHGPRTPADANWPEEVEGQASYRILEALDNIEHHDFQSFIAGLLQALSYKTRVGGRGKDSGVDILAYPDAFGLASPRIKVQTKNQRSQAGVVEVGYLNGVLGSGERGLFVCTGGFTKDALNAPFVQEGRVALVDGAGLLDLILRNYETMPQEARALLPMRRLYIPEIPIPD